MVLLFLINKKKHFKRDSKFVQIFKILHSLSTRSSFSFPKRVKKLVKSSIFKMGIRKKNLLFKPWINLINAKTHTTSRVLTPIHVQIILRFNSNKKLIMLLGILIYILKVQK